MRSNKGWRPGPGADHRKGDERILGSGEFVMSVLPAADEGLERSYALKREGGGRLCFY